MKSLFLDDKKKKFQIENGLFIIFLWFHRYRIDITVIYEQCLELFYFYFLWPRTEGPMHFSDKERGMSCYLPVAKNVIGVIFKEKKNLKKNPFFFIEFNHFFSYSPDCCKN